jgi:hypothetical protein
VEAALFSHQFSRHTDSPDIKAKLAVSRRADQQQQKVVNWLLPPQSPLETTISYEQVAVDLTAWLARSEPDPYLKQTMDFGLLEDFDHLYRYANLYELAYGKKAATLTDSLTEIMPGRPTIVEHRHPADEVRRHYDKHSADPLSKCHVLTVCAAEQQTMNYYMNVGPESMQPVARALYQEIAQIEEQHVSQYESLLDPLETWLESLVLHEFNEVYMYHSFMEDEPDERVRQIWELHLNMELGQLQVACDLLRRYEGKEPEEVLPPALPFPTKFEPNKGYVRDVLASQLHLRTDGTEFVSVDDLPRGHRYFEFQKTVNAGGVPSEQVIEENREKHGRDYRDETEGEHPIPDLRASSRR